MIYDISNPFVVQASLITTPQGLVDFGLVVVPILDEKSIWVSLHAREFFRISMNDAVTAVGGARVLRPFSREVLVVFVVTAAVADINVTVVFIITAVVGAIVVFDIDIVVVSVSLSSACALIYYVSVPVACTITTVRPDAQIFGMI
jgi:hypothetical protein